MDEIEHDEIEAPEHAAHDEGDGPPRRARPSRPWWMKLSVWFVAILIGGIALITLFDLPGLTVFGALRLGALILRTGYFFLQQFATPPPPPPDPGTLRKVKLTYRCSVCGTEVRMTAATNEDPEPPRHCMDDMELVAPILE